MNCGDKRFAIHMIWGNVGKEEKAGFWSFVDIVCQGMEEG